MAKAEEQYIIYGAEGSPYSVKMRAVMRYRRLPHIWVQLSGETRPRIADVKPPVIPVIAFPDGSLHVDSTPMIEELEARHPGERSVVPNDGMQAFLAFLLEDMADEWGTKMMFHYRWDRVRDQETVSRWLAFDNMPGAGRAQVEAQAALFRDRQVGRMALVGSTEANRSLIEGTAREVMALFDAHVTEEPYLFGSRPSRADFAWYGQFYQLASDPTSADIMREEAPWFYRWLARLDDASGVEGVWRDAQAPLPDAVQGLLRLAGEIYLPFLEANAAAMEKGEQTFRLRLRGVEYEQGVFRYQVKCLSVLRAHMAALPEDVRSRLRPVLEETGCWRFLAP